ncbi:TetR family transcriptional regulator [Microbacterium sp. X-17]|uniref:TetR/AcrR family transcriptional regulator n=1 Tax=Microbacterium sp. X-17 TaxID=3144404 RepID=UPI0031F48EEA
MARASSRTDILSTALDLLVRADGRDVSLEAIARACGLTKQGVMYHFPTKDALRVAASEYVLELWRDRLRDELGGSLDVPVADRIGAYAHLVGVDAPPWELRLFAERLYRDRLAGPTTSWFAEWLAVSPALSDEVRGRLLTARMAADRLWFEVRLERPEAVENVAEIVAQIDRLLREAAAESPEISAR